MELDDETMSIDWTMDEADEAGDVFCRVALDFDEVTQVKSDASTSILVCLAS